MSKDTKILQAILDGQKALEERLSEKIDKVDKKLTERIGNLDRKVDEGFKKVNNRLDMQGKQLAYLEDDAPTIKEFIRLKKRVISIESVVYK